MFLLTAPVIINSHILSGIYFIFLRKCPGRKVKVFQYHIWTSVKRSEKKKKLSSKTSFSTPLQLSCSNSGLKLC